MRLASCAYTEFYPMTVLPIGKYSFYSSTHGGVIPRIPEPFTRTFCCTEDGRSVLQCYLGFILGG